MRGFEDLVARLRRSAVLVASRGGGGSGVVWDANGAVVTNAHVARGDETKVIDCDGRALRAHVVKRDTERDLALLETNAHDLEPAAIADSATLRTGQIVVAIGNPLGVAGAVAAGMVHSVGALGIGPRRTWIQADVRLAPGNSGGMLADAEGRVVGINTMIFHGVGLAVPSNEVREFLHGDADRLRLGVEMMPVREGLMVVRIEGGSLAERAGLAIGDVLRSTTEQLRDMLASVKRDGVADLPLLHGGKATTLRVGRHTDKEARAA